MAKNFSLLFTWKNPVTGRKPDFDGFNAVFKASIGADLEKPDLKIEWVAPSAAVIYDTKPSAIDQRTAIVYDVTDATNAGMSFDNIAPLASELGTNLCKEVWKFSEYSHGCVLL